MNFTQDEIAAIVGSQQLQIISLRRQVQMLEAQLQEKVTPIKEQQEAASGTG